MELVQLDSKLSRIYTRGNSIPIRIGQLNLLRYFLGPVTSHAEFRTYCREICSSWVEPMVTGCRSRHSRIKSSGIIVTRLAILNEQFNFQHTSNATPRTTSRYYCIVCTYVYFVSLVWAASASFSNRRLQVALQNLNHLVIHTHATALNENITEWN